MQFWNSRTPHRRTFSSVGFDDKKPRFREDGAADEFVSPKHFTWKHKMGFKTHSKEIEFASKLNFTKFSISRRLEAEEILCTAGLMSRSFKNDIKYMSYKINLGTCSIQLKFQKCQPLDFLL